jgi:hypothetical protein
VISRYRYFRTLPKRFYHVPASAANPELYQLLKRHNIPDKDIYSIIWHAVRRYTFKGRKPDWPVHKRRVGDLR